jgi:hypothetical protein
MAYWNVGRAARGRLAVVLAMTGVAGWSGCECGEPVVEPDAFIEGADAGADAPTIGRDAGRDAGPVGTPGIEVMAPADTSTSETGERVTLRARLRAMPSSDVTVPVASSDTGEGTVGSATLTFTTMNWNAFQDVVVTGVDDTDADGDQTFAIDFGPSTSDDADFDGLSESVTLTNVDDDTAGTAGITLSDASGDTGEDGTTATFTVVLDAAPTADVTLTLASDDDTEGTVAPATLTFTRANWDAPQTVTVTGVDDDLVDGTIAYAVSITDIASSDARYAGLSGLSPVALSNVDDDSSGVTVGAISGTTTEAGGQARFTVVLNSAPTADVTFPVVSSDPTEGSPVAPTITFTTANWDAPQEVVITGVDDTIADGNQMYTVTLGPSTSTDAAYAGLSTTPVSVTNVDDETAGITVGAISGPTSESGGTATFTVRLNSEPTADVVLGLSSTDVGEGTVAPASLTFTAANWNAPQTVTVTGVDDAVVDGNQSYAIRFAPATSTDASYMGRTAADVAVINTDNDTAGFTVSAASGRTNEAGGTATFTIRLNAEPTANVVVSFSSSDTTEGTVATGMAVFTPMNWSSAQSITVTGVDDAIADGNQSYDIVFMAATSTDPAYMGLTPASVRFINDDNDTATFVVSAASRPTTEAGGTATFIVALSTMPSANVTIGLTSNDTTEGTVAPASLTFTTANWNVPQTVTVTGVDDPIVDGNQSYAIVFGSSSSTDGAYNGLTPANVALTNVDNDSAGFLVSAAANTTEAGLSISFSVVLTAVPTGNVTLGFSSSDTTEGVIVGSTSFTFTPANWNVPQFATVRGVNDDLDDGDVVYLIQFAAATSSDAAYAGRRPGDLAIANIDNDTSGFIISPTTVPVGTTTEAGGAVTFSIRLATQPFANVTVNAISRDTTEGTITAGASRTFTPANWNVPQTITVTGVDDPAADGTIRYQVGWNATTSTDALYRAIRPADVPVDNADNDVAGITVSPINQNTNEGGGTATFTIVLNTLPTANVTLNFATNDASEGVSGVTSATFTPSGGTAWNVPQTITVTGQDDSLRDGPIAYAIVFSATTSADAAYAAITPGPVSITNDDNDADCQMVNGIRWCRTGICGMNCTTVCAQAGSTPASDSDVFNAQNDPIECNNLTVAFGLAAYSIGPFSNACAEYVTNSGGYLYCSSLPTCPASHRAMTDGCPDIFDVCGCN